MTSQCKDRRIYISKQKFIYVKQHTFAKNMQIRTVIYDDSYYKGYIEN